MKIHYIPRGKELPVCGAVGFMASTSRRKEVTCRDCLKVIRGKT